jgi:FixJ family two-component response regulator
MSGKSLSGEALPGTGRGADGFLHKPFTQEKLLATIERCLNIVNSPAAEGQPATVVNEETRKAALRETLLELLGQIVDATHGISLTDPYNAPDEVMRLARQAHKSALRLKTLIEDQPR